MATKLKDPHLSYTKGARLKVTRRTGEVITGCKFVKLHKTPTGAFVCVNMPGMDLPYKARPAMVRAY